MRSAHRSAKPFLAMPQQQQLTFCAQRHLSELQQYTCIRELGGGRLFHSYLCRSADDGKHYVVKVLPKRALAADKLNAATVDLAPYLRDLERLGATVRKHQNFASLGVIHETKSALYLGRVFFRYSLFDRLHTHPRMTHYEKSFCAYQLLHALDALHRAGASHGDIKSENVLMTSWGWVVLADSAFYKPQALRAEDPAMYDTFFDAGARRRCYVAPERFYDGQSAAKPPASRPKSSDIFSLGCTIAEIYLDGAAVFDRPQLLRYRTGGFNPRAHIAVKIRDKYASELVLHMTKRDPGQRLDAAGYLRKFKGRLFPHYFHFLHHVMEKFLGPELPTADARVLYLALAGSHIIKELTQPDDVLTSTLAASLASLHDAVRLVGGPNAHGGITPHFNALSAIRVSETGESSGAAPGRPGAPRAAPAGVDKSAGSGIEVVVSALCSCLPYAACCDAKVAGIRLLLRLAEHLSDSVKIDLVIPVAISLAGVDPYPAVRAAAVHAITAVLAGIHRAPSTTRNINLLFLDYIFPNMNRCSKDDAEVVRVAYAMALASLAESAIRLNNTVPAKRGSPEERKRKSGRQKLQLYVAGVAQRMLQDGSPKVKQGILEDITRLFVSLGRQNVLRSVVQQLTPLFNHPDWWIRSLVLRRAVGICVFLGHVCCNEYILPCLPPTLHDAHETVAYDALEAAAALAENQSFSRENLAVTITMAGPLLCHPSPLLRGGVLRFLRKVGEAVSPAIVHAVLLPKLRPFLDKSRGQAMALVGIRGTALERALVAPLTLDEMSSLVRACHRGDKLPAKLTESDGQQPGQGTFAPLLARRGGPGFAQQMFTYIQTLARARRVLVSRRPRGGSITRRRHSKVTDATASGGTRGMGGLDAGALLPHESRHIPISTIHVGISTGAQEQPGGGPVRVRVGDLTSRRIGTVSPTQDGAWGQEALLLIDRSSQILSNFLQLLSHTDAQGNADHDGTRVDGTMADGTRAGRTGFRKSEQKEVMSRDEKSAGAKSQQADRTASYFATRLPGEGTVRGRGVGSHTNSTRVYPRDWIPPGLCRALRIPWGGRTRGTTQSRADEKGGRDGLEFQPGVARGAKSTGVSWAQDHGVLSSGPSDPAAARDGGSIPGYPPRRRSHGRHMDAAASAALENDAALSTTAQSRLHLRGTDGGWLSAHGGPVSALATGPRGRFFVSGSRDGTVKVWNSADIVVTTGARGRFATFTHKLKGAVNGLAVWTDGRVACGSSTGEVALFDVTRGDALPLSVSGLRAEGFGRRRSDAIQSVETLGPLVVTATKAGHISVWDPRCNGVVPNGPDARDFKVTSLAPTVSKGAAMGPAAAVALGNSGPSGMSKPVLSFDAHPSLGLVSAMSVAGPCLACGTDRGRISVWDLRCTLQVSAWQLPSPQNSVRKTQIDGLQLSAYDGHVGGDGKLYSDGLAWVSTPNSSGCCAYSLTTGKPRIHLASDGVSVPNPLVSVTAQDLWRGALTPPSPSPAASAGGVGCVVVANEFQVATAGGADGVVRLWDLTQPKSSLRLPGTLEGGMPGQANFKARIVEAGAGACYCVVNSNTATRGIRKTPPECDRKTGRSPAAVGRATSKKRHLRKVESASVRDLVASGGGITALACLHSQGALLAGCVSGRIRVWL